MCHKGWISEDEKLIMYDIVIKEVLNTNDAPSNTYWKNWEEK